MWPAGLKLWASVWHKHNIAVCRVNVVLRVGHMMAHVMPNAPQCLPHLDSCVEGQTGCVTTVLQFSWITFASEFHLKWRKRHRQQTVLANNSRNAVLVWFEIVKFNVCMQKVGCGPGLAASALLKVNAVWRADVDVGWVMKADFCILVSHEHFCVHV